MYTTSIFASDCQWQPVALTTLPLSTTIINYMKVSVHNDDPNGIVIIFVRLL